MTKGAGWWGDKAAIGLAVLFVAILGVLEFTVYRPQQERLKVAEQDLGKVIGKQGRTAKALRTVLSAASSKVRRRVLLEILE